jgi:hypothetical protein
MKKWWPKPPKEFYAGAQSHAGANAEGRMQNDEGSGKDTQSHPNATSMRHQSHLKA